MSSILHGVRRAIDAYMMETGEKPLGIIVSRAHYDDLMFDITPGLTTEVIAGDPYMGMTIDGVKIEWEDT